MNEERLAEIRERRKLLDSKVGAWALGSAATEKISEDYDFLLALVDNLSAPMRIWYYKPDPVNESPEDRRMNTANDIERRLKYLWVPERDTARYFAERWNGRYLKLPFFDKLPGDAVYVSSTHSGQNRCFGFLFRSAEFDVVPDGEIIPSMSGIDLEYRTIDCHEVNGLAAMKIEALQAELDAAQQENAAIRERNDGYAGLEIMANSWKERLSTVEADNAALRTELARHEEIARRVVEAENYQCTGCSCKINLHVNPNAKSCLGCGTPVVKALATPHVVSMASIIGSAWSTEEPDIREALERARQIVMGERDYAEPKCNPNDFHNGHVSNGKGGCYCGMLKISSGGLVSIRADPEDDDEADDDINTPNPHGPDLGTVDRIAAAIEKHMPSEDEDSASGYYVPKPGETFIPVATGQVIDAVGSGLLSPEFEAAVIAAQERLKDNPRKYVQYVPPPSRCACKTLPYRHEPGCPNGG